MSSDHIIFAGPSISHREIEYAASAAAVGWNLNASGYIKAFEEQMAAYAGQRFALAVSSGSNALHLAFLALGIGAGDEVLVPEIAHVSVATSVAHTGATPVFCDVEPETLCISVADAAAKITERTKGIVPVHMYGHPCDMAGVVKLAVKHNLFIVEDATQAFGSFYRGRPAGSFGNFSVFSFHQDSVLVSGEGGVLLSSDQNLMQTASKLGSNGFGSGNPFVSDVPGYNYAMSNIQAALAFAQLERVQELTAKKRQIFEWYQERLQGVPGIRLNAQLADAQNGYTMTMLFLEDPALLRSDFIRDLAQLGIYSQPVYYPLSSMPMFTRCENPIAYSVGVRALLLPGGHNRTEEEIDYISQVIKALLKNDKDAAANVVPTGWLQYKSEVISILDNAKSGGLNLPFTHDGTNYALRAMTEADIDNPEIISLLTRWRQENADIYLSRLPLSEEVVRSMLSGYSKSSKDYILFFVTCDGKVIGHIGLDNFAFQKHECVVESLIMEQPVPRGLAAAAGEILYAWAKQTLKIKRVYNHVVGANAKVRLLAAAQGFKEIYKLPLYKREVPGGLVFHPMYMPGHDTPDEFFVFSARDL